MPSLGVLGLPSGVLGLSLGVLGLSLDVPGLNVGVLRLRLGVPGLNLDVPGQVSKLKTSFFSMVLHASNAALRKCSDPYKTLAGATKIKVFYISQASRTSSQTTSNRSRSLSYEAFHQDRATNWSLELPSLILEGSGALLGGSWPAFERP